MNNKEYILHFPTLDNGLNRFNYSIREDFFDNLDELEFSNPKLDVYLEVKKSQSIFTLDFHIKGSLELQCDLSVERFDNFIDIKDRFIIKFSNFEKEYDNIIILTNNCNSINLYDYIYDIILLSVPMKKVHPKVLDGTIVPMTLDS